MQVADAHVHLFEDAYAGTWGPLLRNEVEVYEQLRVAFGIGRALVIGYEGEERYRGNNDYILELARTRPWVVPLAYLEDGPPSIDRLLRLREAGAAGYSIYAPDERRAAAVASWPRDVLGELDRQAGIISLNATPAATAALAPFVDRLESCTLLFSHLGLPGSFRQAPTVAEVEARLQPLLALGDRPNVYVKVSGLYAVSEPAHDFPHLVARPLLDALVVAFGVERLCWGSDFAPALEFVSFGQIADPRLLAGLDDGGVAAVMGGNLEGLLPPPRDKE
jgi:predicted TIM-barrel fold metal-dependent hydrolase